MLATHCLGGLDRGDKPIVIGGIGDTGPDDDLGGARWEEGLGASLTWRGGDSIMVKHERARRRR
jgi:hypothetical protein